MEATAMRERVAAARVAHLATVSAEGRPHLVPITFAVDGDVIYFAVDAKPKRTTRLQRLKNIVANPHVAVLVDRYDDDWQRLWWVRVDGRALVLANGPEAERAIDLLAERYVQYRTARPSGPVVGITIDSITGWAADEHPAC